MGEWVKLVNNLNRAGLSPAIILVAMVLIWNGKMMEAYTKGMMSQVKLIHEAQLDDLKRNTAYRQITNNKITKIDARVISLETKDSMLGLPLYQNEGKLYFQDQ